MFVVIQVESLFIFKSQIFYIDCFEIFKCFVNLFDKKKILINFTLNFQYCIFARMNTHKIFKSGNNLYITYLDYAMKITVLS